MSGINNLSQHFGFVPTFVPCLYLRKLLINNKVPRIPTFKQFRTRKFNINIHTVNGLKPGMLGTSLINNNLDRYNVGTKGGTDQILTINNYDK